MGIEMADEELKKFRIDLSTSVSDDLSADMTMPDKPKRVETARRPMVVLLIFIVIIGLVFVWGYHDLRKNLHAVDTTGSTEISVLSDQIDKAFEEVKSRMADRDTAFQAEISRMEAQLKTVESAVGDAQTQKVDKSELKTATTQILTVIESIKKDMAEIRRQVDQLALQTESAIGSLGTVRSDIEENLQQIENLSVKGVDKDALEAALTAEREFIQQNMAHASETVFSQIASLKQALSDLRLQVDTLSRSAPMPAPVKLKTPRKTVDGIIEQEIQ
jgi:chromosome segregation ATPase